MLEQLDDPDVMDNFERSRALRNAIELKENKDIVVVTADTTQKDVKPAIQ